jgi:hypothetical protein
VIRNVVLHAQNEQPLQADLYTIPSASDVGLLCTNLRLMDGKRPVFIDDIKGTFFFPYHVIRFLEIPPHELARHMAEGGGGPSVAAQGGNALSAGAGERLPVVVGGPADGAVAEDLDNLEIELEIDEDFLQRVRDA